MTPAEKVQSLMKYREDLQNRLSMPPPEKRKNHPEAYKEFLNLEIKKVTTKIDKMKMSMVEPK